MRVLALDLGTRTGWAITPTESGVWDLSSRRFEGGGMRFVRFRQHLRQLLATDIEAVYFEEVRRHLGVDAAHIYGGLMAVLTAECEERKVPYAGVPVATIKKTATGKGNSDKTAMVAAAKSQWPGIVIFDDNHADALWLLEHATKENST